MKNNKGFAISSIVYSMLILFLGLILLILGNLANRKAIFDKEKNDILSKFNGSDEILCTAKTTVTNGNLAYGNYDYGDEYTCELGDNDSKTFYVLENNTDTVSLIMNMNIDSNGKGTTEKNKTIWIAKEDYIESGGTEEEYGIDGNNNKGPITALSYLELSTKNWNKLNPGQISLPTAEQLAIASGTTFNGSSISTLASWLYTGTNDYGGPEGYWTSTADASISSNIWVVNVYNGIRSEVIARYYAYGVRPVITISKDQISNLDPILCTLVDGQIYAIGSKYICDVGDSDDKTFYALETDNNNISLIMNMNVDENGKGTIEGNTVAWCTYGDYISAGGTDKELADGNFVKYGPVTAIKELKNRTITWTKLSTSQISLPTRNQIYKAAGNTESNLPTWLYENLSNDVITLVDPISYWLLESYNNSYGATVGFNAQIGGGFVGNTVDASGIRPVITISKTRLV